MTETPTLVEAQDAVDFVPASTQPGVSIGPWSGPVEDRALSARVGWSIVWLGVLSCGIGEWGDWWFNPVATIVSLFLIAASLAGVTWCWTSRDPGGFWPQRLAMFSVGLTIVAAAQHALAFTLGTGTDEAAFSRFADQQLLHGRNPFVVSMAGVDRLFHVPPQYWTYTLTGSHVGHLSYPAGSFLLTLAPVAFGVQHPINLVNVLAWIVTVFMLWRLLPSSISWLAGVLAPFGLFTAYVFSGLLDPLYLPFTVMAVWRWDRYGDGREGSAARWVGPIALGLACTVKQNPWLLFPFLLVGIALETRRRGGRPLQVAFRYGCVVVVTFLGVNLPFIAWSPSAWLHTVMLPFTSPAIPDGQGLVSFFVHLAPHGVEIQFLTWMAAAAVLLGLSAFWLWYPVLKRVLPLLATIPLFFGPRSFSSYFVFLIPTAVVAAATSRPVSSWGPMATSSALRGRRLGVVAVGLASALAALGLIGSLVVRPPLTVSIVSTKSGQGGQRVSEVVVDVRNSSGVPLHPAFAVTSQERIEQFWRVASGSSDIPPRTSVRLELVPPSKADLPYPSTRWLVLAFTTSPSAVSRSDYGR